MLDELPKPVLRPENQSVRVDGVELVRALMDVEVVLISLHRIGSHFAYAEGETFDKAGYQRETTRFIDEWRVCERLARVRRRLDSALDDTLGADDMEDSERACQDLPLWASPESRFEPPPATPPASTP